MDKGWKKVFESFDFKLSDYSKLVGKIKFELAPRTIILLDGPLGAGKTTFTNQLCNILEIESVSSPTYALHQTYQNQKITIDHFDLYRLESSDDVESIGLWDIFSKQQGLVIVEWSSKIDLEDWPVDWKIIKIEFLKNQERRAVLAFTE